jgi:putative membrane protein
MKNHINLLLKLTFVSAIIISTSACTNNKAEDTKEVAEEHNEAKFEKRSSEKDAQFLVNAAEINLEEISLGKLAQQNSTILPVKDLGKMMEDAHGQSLAELTELALAKNITLPTSATNDALDTYKKLSTKTGVNFGKSYSDLMVSGHKDAIDLFEKAAADCTDPEIKAWAAKSLPSLRTHLDKAINCQKECEKM